MYNLFAMDAEVRFSPSPSGKTVVVRVLGQNLYKKKRMRADKARELYVALYNKGYVTNLEQVTAPK